MKDRYGSPLLNNKRNPLDELVFILLSQMTTAPSYERVYNRLKSALPDWKHLIDLPDSCLSTLIADAGLSKQRARRLKLIAEQLMRDFGRVSLDRLFEYNDDRALKYLTSLPGIGLKSAKCVMMYSLGRQVLPVDTHTARVAYRLGLVQSNDHVLVDRELSVVVPPVLRFDFHVNSVVHGRVVCRATRPKCDECTLNSLCPTGKKFKSQS